MTVQRARTLSVFLFVAAFMADGAAAQEGPTLEERVLELLVGQENRIYIEGRPDWWGIMALGEAALPIVLKHAADSDKSYDAAGRVIEQFAARRIILPDSVRNWVRAELRREKVDLGVIRAAGELGLGDQIPRLDAIARSGAGIASCRAVQAIAAIGSEEARSTLAELRNSDPNGELGHQAKVLLDHLYTPFLGSGSDARILNAIDTAPSVSLKYAAFGSISPSDRLTRRLVHANRKDLAPGLRNILTLIEAKDEETQKREASKRISILRALRLLGGDLSADELKNLQDARIVDLPQNDK